MENRRSYCLVMSLTEIEEAMDKLSPEELAKLAAHIARRDKVAWDQEIEQDFSPGGKHVKVLKKTDAQIEAGNFMPLPSAPMRCRLSRVLQIKQRS
jgi:hypothetical protein